MRRIAIALVLVVASSTALAQRGSLPAQGGIQITVNGSRTSEYFDRIKRDPILLRSFLKDFPKGADLHHHLSGAVYAENFIALAAKGGVCYNMDATSFVPRSSMANCPDGAIPADSLFRNTTLYRQAINGMSLRHFDEASAIGSDQFFDSFGKFGLISSSHPAEMLIEVILRAREQNQKYLETIITLDGGRSRGILTASDVSQPFGQAALVSLADKVRRDPRFESAVAAGSSLIDAIRDKVRDSIGCNIDLIGSGDCDVAVRFEAQIARAAPLETVFAQTLAAFALAERDDRVVGLNFVQPEESYLSMTNFDKQMLMLDYFHTLYPNVRVSLHAGELTMGLVTPSELGRHIRSSIELGHARRIGHGVDLAFDKDPRGLLEEMRRQQVAVEVCITSNDAILGVTGNRHPISHYIKAGVPVVLCTDDEGVSRSDLTNEYERGVLEHELSYDMLKDISRNGIRYAFVKKESERRELLARLERALDAFEEKYGAK